MPALSPEAARARATIGGLRRRGASGDDPRVLDAKRDLAAAQLADHIARVVDAAPPLTDEQRDRLALLLRPTEGRRSA